MDIQIIRADKENDEEIRVLAALDVKIFPHETDLFNEEDWQYFRKIFEFFWILGDGVVVGSIHLGPNLEWEKEDLPSSSSGCLYAAGLGILPEFRHRGIASFAKQWQIDYAKAHGFCRIVANCRKSNVEMIGINQKFGFKIAREIPDFWMDPDEPAVILELKL